jgi:hypothetical protein
MEWKPQKSLARMWIEEKLNDAAGRGIIILVLFAIVYVFVAHRSWVGEALRSLPAAVRGLGV